MNNRRFLNKKDFIVIFVLLISALLFYFIYSSIFEDKPASAEILLESSVVKKVDLSHNSTFSLPQLPNVTFEVRDGKIAFISSDCPDKICIRTGFIFHSGESAACLPNKISIRIVPSSPDAFDAVI